nr:immunoglobulin heavy chain junction region [Macaca mulatta]
CARKRTYGSTIHDAFDFW